MVKALTTVLPKCAGLNNDGITPKDKGIAIIIIWSFPLPEWFSPL